MYLIMYNRVWQEPMNNNAMNLYSQSVKIKVFTLAKNVFMKREAVYKKKNKNVIFRYVHAEEPVLA